MDRREMMYRATITKGDVLIDQMYDHIEDNLLHRLYNLYEDTQLSVSLERVCSDNNVVETTRIFTIDSRPDVCV